ncbi:hypothetical protein [Nonomuraea sp. NPDC046570]|uniref:hypothetical protein n=1 Tax=Nonomuraea sp. NPDC046570 TaxID=3155255 RepID=UPI0033EC9D3E
MPLKITSSERFRPGKAKPPAPAGRHTVHNDPVQTVTVQLSCFGGRVDVDALAGPVDARRRRRGAGFRRSPARLVAQSRQPARIGRG